MKRTTPSIKDLVSIIREYNIACEIRARESVEPKFDSGFEYLKESATIASNFLQATLHSYELTKAPNVKVSEAADET